MKKILSRPKKIGIKIRSLHETYKTITTIEKKLTALKRLARVKKAAARLRAVKSARGRPKKSVTKQRVDMRFDPDVINGLKSHFGRGWSTKVNDEMRKLLVKSKVL
ncbi:MAG: BrnA antitoxin family protein [Alphaproteobacteria bacterium]|nr:BrnA antitoxin family protein [Alphaproteobacteria bacterium]